MCYKICILILAKCNLFLIKIPFDPQSVHQKLAFLTLIIQRHREDVRHEINKGEVWKNERGDTALFELCCPCCILLEQALLANTMEQLNNFQAQGLLEGKFSKLRIPNCNQTLGKKQYWNTTLSDSFECSSGGLFQKLSKWW